MRKCDSETWDLMPKNPDLGTDRLRPWIIDLVLLNVEKCYNKLHNQNMSLPNGHY